MAVNKSVYYKRLNKWADALVSRKYKQIGNRLRDADNGRCCLGVACDVSGLADWTKTGKYLGDAELLPKPVQDYYGLTDAVGEGVLEKASPLLHESDGGLAELNDSGKYTFGKIAKIIRKFAEIKYGPSSKKSKKSKT